MLIPKTTNRCGSKYFPEAGSIRADCEDSWCARWRPLVAALEPPRAHFPHFDAQLAKTLLLIMIAHTLDAGRCSRDWFFFRSSRPHLPQSCTFEPDERANTIKLISQWKFYSHRRQQEQKTSVDFVVSRRGGGTRAARKITSATLFLSFFKLFIRARRLCVALLPRGELYIIHAGSQARFAHSGCDAQFSALHVDKRSRFPSRSPANPNLYTRAMCTGRLCCQKRRGRKRVSAMSIEKMHMVPFRLRHTHVC